MDGIESDDISALPDVHATSAGLKAFCTWTAHYGIDTCRWVQWRSRNYGCVVPTKNVFVCLARIVHYRIEGSPAIFVFLWCCIASSDRAVLVLSPFLHLFFVRVRIPLARCTGTPWADTGTAPTLACPVYSATLQCSARGKVRIHIE